MSFLFWLFVITGLPLSMYTNYMDSQRSAETEEQWYKNKIQQRKEVEENNKKQKLFVESLRKIRSKGIRVTIKTHQRLNRYGGGEYCTYHIDNWKGPYNKDGIIEYASKL